MTKSGETGDEFRAEYSVFLTEKLYEYEVIFDTNNMDLKYQE